MSGGPDHWPLFLAYRQRDGKDAAEWLYRHLHDRPVADAPLTPGEPIPLLSVYYDQTAAAVADWKAVHGSALDQARALILICSPGVAALRPTEDDHVFAEISWWIEHRPTAPIFVDNTGDDDRWIPEIAGSRWPDAQRIRIVTEELETLSTEEREREETRIADRICMGIIASQTRVVDQELAQERRRSRRLRSQLASIAVLLVATLVAAVFATSYWRKSETLLVESQMATEEAETELYYSTILLSQQYIENAQYGLALTTLERSPESLRNWEWGHLVALACLELPGRTVEEPVFIGGRGETSAPASFDPVVWRWVERDGSLVPDRVRTGSGLGEIAFSRDGRRHVRADGAVARVLDAEDGAVVAELVGHQGAVRNACLSLDGLRVATVSDDRTARIWDVETGRELAVLRGHRDRVLGAAFSPDGSRIVTVSDDGSGAVWDAATGRQVVTLLTLNDQGFRSGADPYGILVGGARAHSEQVGDALSRYRSEREVFWRAPSFSPDGRSIAVEVAEETLVWSSYAFRSEHLAGGSDVSWSERFESWQVDWDRRERSRMTAAPGVSPAWVEEPTPVRVSDAEELLASIGPDRVVELAAGTYDLTPLQGRPGEFIRWDGSYDGSTLTIHDVANLVIRGAAGARVEIVTQPGYVFVLCLDGCTRVELRNLVLGHAPDPGGCEAGVVGAVGCSRLSFVDCEIFGSGTEGLTLLNVTDAQFERVTIRDCTYGIMTIDHCTGLRFREMRLVDNEEFWGVIVARSRDVLFLDTEIERNRVDDPLFDVTGSHNVAMTGGRIRDNQSPGLERHPGSVLFENVAIDDPGDGPP